MSLDSIEEQREGEGRRFGLAVIALEEAKERGWDWLLHSSWCSDQPCVICLVRMPRGFDRLEREPRPAAGTPFVGKDSFDAISKALAFIAAVEEERR